MSRNVFDTHNICLKWFLATLQLFKVKGLTNYCLKIGYEWDSERFDILLFFAFLVRPLTLNICRVAKNHLRHMLWVSKIFLNIMEIRQSKNYGHTTRRSGDNARKLKNISKIASKWGLNEIQKGMIFCIFSHFWVLSLTLNSCRVAKNHLRHMLWVWKTFLDIRGIRQYKKNMVIQHVEVEIMS